VSKDKHDSGAGATTDVTAALKRIEDQMKLIRENLPKPDNEKPKPDNEKPKPDNEKPTGKIETSEKFGYLTEQVVYASAREIAAVIGKQLETIVGDKKKTILLVNKLDSASNDIVYIELLLQFRIFDSILVDQITANKRIETVIGELLRLPPKPGRDLISLRTVASAVPYAVNAMAEIASYFRTDYKIAGMEVKVSDNALIAAVAGELAKINEAVFIDAHYLLDIPPGQITTYTGLIDALKSDPDALSNLNLLEGIMLYLNLVTEATKSRATLQIFIKEYSDDKNFVELLDKAKKEIEHTDAVLKLASEFFKNISTAKSGETSSKLGNALMREKIRRIGGTGVTHLLSLVISSSGGDAITVRTFLSGSNKYVGGLVVSYVLSTIDGKVLAADTISRYAVMNFDLRYPIYDHFTIREFKKDEESLPFF